MEEKILSSINAHLAVFETMRTHLLSSVIESGRLMADALIDGKKILIAGNGGSAADAQHFAAEIVGRYIRERQALSAIALTTDTSILTAVGNDYGFDQVFSRQIEGLGRSGDIFVGISTSGQSLNLIQAIHAAKKRGLHTIALLGKGGGEMAQLSDTVVLVPSRETPRIQEAHHWIYHTWCEIIDERY